jgi:tetratricopeptide (TPR) repeat protein
VTGPLPQLRARLPGYVGLALLTLCLALYARGLGGPFILDDIPAIEQSPHVRSLWPLSQSMTGFEGSAVAGKPVLCLTLAMNHAVHGMDARGFRMVNILLHAGTAMLLFAVVVHALRRLGFDNRSEAVAFAVAVIWAVHPLHTMSLQCVALRGELLAGFFLLLTLYAVTRGRSVLAVAACLLGMGSSPTMAVAPLLVLLYDRAFITGSLREAWRRHRWLYVGLAATWLPLIWLMTQGHRSSSAASGQEVAALRYLLTQPGVLVHYLKLSVWPESLSLVYAWPVVTRISEWMLPASAVTGMLVLTGCGLWRNTWYGFVGAWCFLLLGSSMLAISSSEAIVAEHRTYLPLAGVLAAGLAALLQLSSSVTGVWRWQAAATASAAMLLAVVTGHRVADYRSDLAIWSDTAAKQPHSHLAHHNLGLALQERGDLDGAMQHYQQALELRPDYRASRLNLANCQWLNLRFDDAAATYRALLLLDPSYPPAHNNLGLLLARRGQTDEAMQHFTAAVDAEPRYADARVNLAVLLSERGHHDEARRHLDTVLQLAPDHMHALRLREAMVQVAEVTTKP